MSEISDQIAKLGDAPITEDSLARHIWPLFSRVRERESRIGQIYLANHSLGRPLDQTARDLAEFADTWYDRMDDAWDLDAWMGELQRYRQSVAKLIGASDATCIAPKTSAGQGLRAVLNSLPQDRQIRVVATRGEFDSIDFILKAYVESGRAQVRWIEPEINEDGLPLFDSESIITAIEPGVDLLVISMAVFNTGQLMPELDIAIGRAKEVRSLVLLDAYHAAGVVPIDFVALEADFMIGGSYKYTRGGPGACWLAVNPKHFDGPLRTLDTGWFAKRDTFLYLRPETADRAAGGDAWLESTPPIVTYYQARAGLELTLGIGVDRLREYSLKQLEALRIGFVKQGVACFEPKDPRQYGGFALVPSSDASELSNKLKLAGVNTDARGNFVRFGPDILNSFEEISRAASITAGVLSGT
jgi:kynureninase